MRVGEPGLSGLEKSLELWGNRWTRVREEGSPGCSRPDGENEHDGGGVGGLGLALEIMGQKISSSSNGRVTPNLFTSYWSS